MIYLRRVSNHSGEKMPTPSETAAKVASVLARKLPGIPANEVKNLAKIIGQLNAKGLKVEDAFPEGIVSPDAITIVGTLNLNDLSKLGDILLVPGSKVKAASVFPQGIPSQEEFMRVNLKIGR